MEGNARNSWKVSATFGKDMFANMVILGTSVTENYYGQLDFLSLGP